jgi:hypothetical protein
MDTMMAEVGDPKLPHNSSKLHVQKERERDRRVQTGPKHRPHILKFPMHMI